MVLGTAVCNSHRLKQVKTMVLYMKWSNEGLMIHWMAPRGFSILVSNPGEK